MPRIEWAKEASTDLRDIGRYIAEQDGEARASKIVGRILGKLDLLAFMPHMGTRKPYLGTGSLSFADKPWTIIYDPLPDGIRVLRIVDGRRDLPALLRPPPEVKP